jgi:hypothetical protein
MALSNKAAPFKKKVNSAQLAEIIWSLKKFQIPNIQNIK